MLLSLALAYIAGALSTLSPCVLPLIPILAGTALSSGQAAPMALAGGLVISFATVGSVLGATGAAASTGESIRLAGAALLAAFGLVLLLPPLQRAVARALQPLATALGPLMQALPGNGLTGQFGVGLVLGIVWSPCTGPALGAAASLAATRGSFSAAVVTMLAFGLGAATPLLAFTYAGRAGGQGMVRARRWAAIGTPMLGAAMLVAGGLVLTGADRLVEAAATAHLPAWWVDWVTRF
jgi:cytochrome c-type biogenesis protein